VSRILVVDDDDTLLRTLTMNLRARGHSVLTAATGADGLATIRSATLEVIILDLGLPDITGLDVLRELRGWSAVPVIVLSARHGSEDKVAALDLGADDYITKPFGIDELLARLRAAVRRAGTEGPSLVQTASLHIDVTSRRVARDGEEVRLTPIEWGLLAALVTRPGRLVPQRQLLQEV
jgi:two-component system, OmpR family, KDP operon response regulator KdpE